MNNKEGKYKIPTEEEADETVQYAIQTSEQETQTDNIQEGQQIEVTILRKGSKGDPIAKTPTGKVIIIKNENGTTPQLTTNKKYQVTITNIQPKVIFATTNNTQEE